MLEETGLAYSAYNINLAKGEQRQAGFLKLNSSGRIPVLVDHDNEQTEPLVLTQSTAILLYLAEKTGKLIPESLRARAKVYEWMHFHAVDIGSTIFNALYLQQRSSPKQIEAAEQLTSRVHELYRYFDEQLAEHEFLAGDDYSIADITTLPVVITQQKKLIEYPDLMRWVKQLKQRPAVKRGMAVPEKEVSHEN
jgi:GST-like protein